MNAYKISSGLFQYGIAAESRALAIEKFEELSGDKHLVCEEIPESEWDKKTINIWEDNDFSKQPYKISIREAITGNEPQLIFTSDKSLF